VDGVDAAIGVADDDLHLGVGVKCLDVPHDGPNLRVLGLRCSRVRRTGPRADP
jgi:hypothetical protein